MASVAHFTVTYPGASWLRSQILTIKRYRSITVSWARDADDVVTQSDSYFQLVPQSAHIPGGVRLTQAAAITAERIAGRMTRQASRILQNENATLIHAHFGRAGYYAIPLAQRTGLPLLTSFYGYDLSEYPTRYPHWRENYRKLFEAGMFFLVEGSHMRQTLIALGCPEEKALHQRLGIDLAKFPFRPRIWIPGTPLNVLQVARIREKKGIPDSVRAFAGLARTFPEARFTLLGDLNSPAAKPIMAEVQSIIDQASIASSVRLLNEVPYDEYAEILKQAHIFLQPSVVASSGDTEGGAPVSLIEASASGMMVVATRHCDIPEVILDSESGLLADEHDVDALTAHLIALARMPEKWKAMAETGRQHIERDYDLHHQIAVLETIYDRALS
jgi:colanic acid/amylovoran biosynthesis glycosyltransferase